MSRFFYGANLAACVAAIVMSTGCMADGREPVVAGGIMADELDPLAGELFALNLSPGMAVAVVKDGDLVYAQGFGYADVDSRRPVDLDTQFYIASTSKSFCRCSQSSLP